MTLFLLLILLLCVIWFAKKNNQQSSSAETLKTGIRIIKTHPYNNDFVSLKVKSSGSFIRFDIAGIGYRKGVEKCVGEFDGWLEAEPTNPHDSEAIKIMHPNGTHVGYVPRNYNGDRVRYPAIFPRVCHCIILRGEKGYYGICVVPDSK